MHPNHAEGVNVKEQMDNPDSMLNYCKRLIHVRKTTPALVAGEYKPLHPRAEDYFAFLRYTES